MKLPEGWPTEEMVAAGFEVVRLAAPNERAFRIALFRAMLAAAPTPPAQDQADWEDVDRLVKTLAYIQGIIERGEGRKMRGDEFIGEFVLNYVKKLERPAQEDAPVGYITPVYILGKQDHAQISRNREYEWQVPLFSHPADDKLRKAAEEVLAILREEEERCKGWARDQNIKIQRVLSAALEGR